MGSFVKSGLIATAGVLAVGGLIYLVRSKYYGSDGYNSYGYNREGRDRYGFDRKGYDRDGFDRNGYDNLGFDVNGYDHQGFNKLGWNREGYSRSGFDRDGYDRNGRDHQGFDRLGYCPAGIDRGGLNRQMANDYIRDVENLKKRAWAEMKASNFREALTNIRTGIDNCVMLILKHKTGQDYDNYDISMQCRIEKCFEYNMLTDDEVCKLQEARKHSNSIHKLHMNKEFNQVYFCLKTLEELIAKTKKCLDIENYNVDAIQFT